MAICPKPVQTSRRNDLQGIRGIAILSVLGFHFYPKTFPNGYLGVDQFFVLSGFLMCMLLTRSQKLPIHKMFFEFYTRRFRRILPLYFLFVLSTILALYTVFPETAVFLNEMSAEKALLFVSNRPHSREEDYFEKLSLAMDLFTHTWSLSVEIQFYLIAPIIFLIGHRFKGASKHAFYSTTATISFAFHIFSPSTTSFNSVFARIWQFLIGMMIYLWSRSQSLPYAKSFESGDEETSKTGNLFVKCLVLTSIVAMVLFPKELNPIFVRPLMTLCTASLLLFNVEDWILNSRFLIYLGDISYALYLVHWPVYAYCRLSFPPNVWILNGALLLSVVLAIVVFETYEKWYLKQSNMVIAVLVTVLFLSSGLLVNVDQIRDSMQEKTFDSDGRKFPRLDGVTANMTFGDVCFIADPVQIFDFSETFLNTPRPSTQDIYDHCLKMLQDKKQFIAFLQERGGTGKAHTIRSIVSILKPSQYLLIAATNTSAREIGGETIHKALKPPIHLFDTDSIKYPHYPELQFVVFDEVSMMSGRLLKILEKALRKMTGKDESFGGCSVLLSGDLRQLSIGDDRVFRAEDWYLFDRIELTESIRHSTDQEFADHLSK